MESNLGLQERLSNNPEPYGSYQSWAISGAVPYPKTCHHCFPHCRHPNYRTHKPLSADQEKRNQVKRHLPAIQEAGQGVPLQRTCFSHLPMQTQPKESRKMLSVSTLISDFRQMHLMDKTYFTFRTLVTKKFRKVVFSLTFKTLSRKELCLEVE